MHSLLLFQDSICFFIYVLSTYISAVIYCLYHYMHTILLFQDATSCSFHWLLLLQVSIHSFRLFHDSITCSFHRLILLQVSHSFISPLSTSYAFSTYPFIVDFFPFIMTRLLVLFIDSYCYRFQVSIHLLLFSSNILCIPNISICSRFFFSCFMTLLLVLFIDLYCYRFNFFHSFTYFSPDIRCILNISIYTRFFSIF